MVGQKCRTTTTPRVNINEGQKLKRATSPKSVAMRASAPRVKIAAVKEIDGVKGQNK